MRLYDKLGFVINLQKSRTVPTQRIRILGFAIDTVKMIITHILHFKESCNLIGWHRLVHNLRTRIFRDMGLVVKY